MTTQAKQPGNRWHFRKKIFFSLHILILLSSIPALSQKIRFDRLSVKEGLSQGNVADIFQDKLGFIWIGTEDGLNLYDGYTFTIFRHNPDDPFSLSNNNIDSFAEDQDGNLWIGTQNGLNYYNRELNRFERFYENPADPGSLSNSDIGHVYFDSKGNLWVGTLGGLNLYNASTKTFKRFLHDPNQPNSLAHNIVEGILEDNLHQIWVATGNGLSMLNSDGKTFTNFYHNPTDPTTLSSNKTRCLIEDRDHNLWIGTFDGGINKMDSRRKTFTRYLHDPSNPKSLGNNYVTSFAENKAGELWLTTDGTIDIINKKEGTFTHYSQQLGDETSLSSSITVKVFFDRNDRMWVGTRFGGVNVYDRDKYGFRHFKYNSNQAFSLNNNNITAFVEHKDGNFWIGTDGGGLNYYDRKTGKFTNYFDLTTNNKVLAIAQDKNEGLWLGMWAGGLNYFDTKTKKVKRYLNNPADPNSLSDNNIFDILIDASGTVWIATFANGLNKYNPETDNFTRYLPNPNNANSINSLQIEKLIQDSFGKIWIGTEQDGLDMFDPDTEIFTHYVSGVAPGQLSGNSVLALYEDSKRRLWVGTNGDGLNLFDRETKTFTVFRQKDGLPNDGIMGILEDQNGNIWVSTNKGLSRYNPETQVFKNFTESDGLQGDQFNRWSYLRLSTGELLFGGTNGFNMFNAGDIKENTFKPPVYLTDFRLFNKPVPIGEKEILKKNILFTSEINLSYFQNIFSFEFTALNYTQSEKNKYRYIMEGFQDEWIDAGGERKVSYTNLSPGKYTFRVIASNNDNVWNDEGVALTINIIPPFWKTWWFNSGLILLALLGVVNYTRYQKKKAKHQQAELQRIIEERTRALSLQNEEIIKKAEQEKIYNWITQGLALVSETISKNNSDLNALGDETLRSVIKYVKAQQGILAIAIKDDATDVHLKILATYGVSKSYLDERIEVGSGMLGEAYREKEIRFLDHLPENYIKIESGLGQAPPSNIILLPLKTDDGDVVGVMELAFLDRASPVTLEFLEKVSSLIALNIYATTLSHKTMLLLQQSKEQTEEMRAQEEEMRQNMEELEATSEEFRRREMEYQKRIEELESMVVRKM